MVNVSVEPYAERELHASVPMRTDGCRPNGPKDSVCRIADRFVDVQSGCSSNAAVWCGHDDGVVTRSASSSFNASPASKRSCRTQQPPAARVPPITMQKPAVQKNGNALHDRTSPSSAKCRTNRHDCSAGARCACSTAFGFAVEPDV